MKLRHRLAALDIVLALVGATFAYHLAESPSRIVVILFAICALLGALSHLMLARYEANDPTP